MTQLSIIKNGVRVPDNRRVTRHKKGNTADIIETILHADKFSKRDTSKVAHRLKGGTEKETVKNVWKFTSDAINYVADEPGLEVVKAPSVTVYDGYGDCKSMTLLASSFLKNLNFLHRFRFAGYKYFNELTGQWEKDRNVTHVYLIVTLSNGEEVVLDATNDKDFNYEVPVYFSKDYFPMEYQEQMGIRGVYDSKKSNTLWQFVKKSTPYLIGALILRELIRS